MTTRPLQDRQQSGRAKLWGVSSHYLRVKIIDPARRHCWFWIPMVGVTTVSAMVSSMFLMGGIIATRVDGQLGTTIGLFCTSAAFIILPPLITLAILRSAVPPPEPGAGSEQNLE